MNKSLIRSIGFWLLIVLSLASAGVGAWLVNSQLTTMTTTLLDGTATGVEVYVGQSLAVLGSTFIGAGVIGILVALALVAVRSLIPASAPVALEPIDWAAEAAPVDAEAPAATADETIPTDAEPTTVEEPTAEAATGSTEEELSSAARG